jgi:hypothetical protein
MAEEKDYEDLFGGGTDFDIDSNFAALMDLLQQLEELDYIEEYGGRRVTTHQAAQEMYGRDGRQSRGYVLDRIRRTQQDVANINRGQAWRQELRNRRRERAATPEYSNALRPISPQPQTHQEGLTNRRYTQDINTAPGVNYQPMPGGGLTDPAVNPLLDESQLLDQELMTQTPEDDEEIMSYFNDPFINDPDEDGNPSEESTGTSRWAAGIAARIRDQTEKDNNELRAITAPGVRRTDRDNNRAFKLVQRLKANNLALMDIIEIMRGGLKSGNKDRKFFIEPPSEPKFPHYTRKRDDDDEGGGGGGGGQRGYIMAGHMGATAASSVERIFAAF